MNLLRLSGSPHIHTNNSVQKIMWTVIIALLPAMVFSFIYYRWDAVRVVMLSVATCVILEWLFQKIFFKGKQSISNGSAVITGILLAFSLPSRLGMIQYYEVKFVGMEFSLPWMPNGWLIILGAVVAIGIAKTAFGGLGKNIFNPALAGRVFLFFVFPQQMTKWALPKPAFFGVDALTSATTVDATTGATPLSVIKQAMVEGQNVTHLLPLHKIPNYAQLLLGERGGSLGEVAALAIILGGIILLVRKVITWHIPVTFIGTVYIFAAILHQINPDLYIMPQYEILVGGLLLGAVFMATDMVTSPMVSSGKIIFGVGCGVLTMLIRIWANYPEGVSISILIMNAFVPFIDKGFKPAQFGTKTVYTNKLIHAVATIKSNFRNIFLSLFFISIVAAVVLGVVNHMTEKEIKIIEAPQKSTTEQVLPPFDELKETKIVVQTAVENNSSKQGYRTDTLSVYDAYKNNKWVGTAVETFSDKGFGGRIDLMVGFLPNGNIYKIVVLKHSESPERGGKMKSKWADQFIGKNPATYKLAIKKDGGDVDAITGATNSSKAYSSAVQDAYTIFIKNGGKIK